MTGITRTSALIDASTQHYVRDCALIAAVLLAFIIFGTLLWRRYK